MRGTGLVVFVCASAAALSVGCISAAPEFGSNGWGGPTPIYSTVPGDGSIRLDQGILVHRDFRWADAEFSFEFFDAPALVWGIYLFDDVFLAARRQALRGGYFKIGDKVFVPGKNLPAEHLWKFDAVVDMMFRDDEKAGHYKVADAVWYQSFYESGKVAYRVKATHDVRIEPQTWNRFRGKMSGGMLTYWVNDVPGASTLQVDKRANGRLGFFVSKGGPLRVRNLKLTP